MEKTGVILGIGNRKKARKEHKMKRKIIPKKPYNTSGYYVTNHAVKRMNERQVSKGELGYNLRHKPRFKTSVTNDYGNEPSYGRFSWNRIFAAINPFRRRVITTYPYGEKTLKKAQRKEKRRNGKGK